MKKYKIILVENDEDERFFMNEGFQGSGLFEIIAQVVNGDELFEWLEEHPRILPDVILSDLNMPGKNGYDIITEMTNSPGWSHIPVIIASTSSTATIIDKCMNLGAAGYVVKPETFVAYVPFVKDLHKMISEKQLVKT
jgi:CheY-like chemotaxis protein